MISKDLYTTSDDFVISDIVEYDMRDAGYNIIKSLHLLDDNTINALSEDKTKRKIEIGKLQRKDKQLALNLKNGFRDYREKFIISNDIIDDEIIAIKKDAIFVTKYCYDTIFDSVEFVEKNIYSIFAKLNRYEVYIGDNKIDIKGIHDDILEHHKPYMMSIINRTLISLAFNDKKSTIRQLVSFINDYKHRRCNINMYKPLNSDKFNMKLNDQIISIESLGQSYVQDVDISWNYRNIIIPLINLVNS